MAVANPHVKFRYEDYKSLPESETRRYELLDGELVMVPSPTERHQRALRALFLILGRYMEDHGVGELYCAPLDVVLGEGAAREVVQPDILFIARERAHVIAEDGIHGAPDLVVEILSPVTAERDRTYKRALYARHGVREYWLVDPETRAIEVLVPAASGFECAASYAAEAGETLVSPLLAGLEVPLARVF